MKNLVLVLTLALLGFTSCTQDKYVDLEPVIETNKGAEILSATSPCTDNGAEIKVVTDNGGTLMYLHVRLAGASNPIIDVYHVPIGINPIAVGMPSNGSQADCSFLYECTKYDLLLVNASGTVIQKMEVKTACPCSCSN